MEGKSQQSFSNQNYTNATALQMRLDTQKILENIELFLRGARIVVEKNDKGKIVTKTLKTGTPKANDLGIQSIMNYMESVINPHVVQGNFTRDGWESYVMEQNIEFASDVMENLYEWAIKESDFNFIIDTILAILIPFTSRLIENKERESYVDTIKSNSIEGAISGNSKAFKIL